jgi:aspartate-semialdehyde dehydrogenase
VYPSPLEAAGRDEVLVGRIRLAPDHDDALLLFACGDNLRSTGSDRRVALLGPVGAIRKRLRMR